MRTINPKTKASFAVSLMMIFGYSMLMVMVPPTQSGANALLTEQAPASTDPGQGGLVLRADADEPAQDDAAQSLQ